MKRIIVISLVVVLLGFFVIDYGRYRAAVTELPVGGATGEYVRGWGYVPFVWDGHLTGTLAFSKNGKGGVSLALDGESYISTTETENKFEVVSSSGLTTLRGNLTILRYGDLETVSIVTGQKQTDYPITEDIIAQGLRANGVDTISAGHRTMLLAMTAFQAKTWVEDQLNGGVWFWNIRDVMAVSAYCQEHPQWENVTIQKNTGQVLHPLAILEYEIIDQNGTVLGSYIRPVRKATWLFCRDTWNWHLT